MPNSILRYYPYCLFFIVLTLALCFAVQSNDLFFYLSMGRIFFNTGHFPSTDPFLYTAQNWNIYHQWLAYLAFYLSYLVGGFTSVILFKALLWLGIFFILAVQAVRSKVPTALAIFTLSLTAIACSQRFIERGALFSELFTLALAYLLLNGPSISRRKLIALPLLFLLWVNFHGGFIIGLFMLTAYAAIHWREVSREFWLSLAACFVACLINPEFFYGFVYPIKTGFGPDWKYYRQFNPEWMPTLQLPFLLSWQVRTLLLLFILTLCSWSVLTYKNRRVFPFLGFLFLLHMYLGQNALRFVSTAAIGFALLTLYIWPLLKLNIPVLWERIASGVFAVVLVAVGVRMCLAPYGSAISMPDRSVGFGINPGYFPVNAAEMMKKNNLSGRIFNQFSWGSYLIWSLDQRDFLFIHGNVDDPKLMAVDFLGAANSKVTFQYTVDKYAIKFCLMQKDPPQEMLDVLKDWKLIYQDGLSALWAH